MSLLEIFVKATSPAVPPKVPIRGSYQEKLKQLHQEKNPDQKIYLNQKLPFINAKTIRVPIMEAYPEELQQAPQAKKRIKNYNQAKVQQLHPEKGNLGK